MSLPDPGAHVTRRAWLRVPCPSCGMGTNCPDCAAVTTCNKHWWYLLGTNAGNVFAQCSSCFYRHWYSTGCGVGNRPEWLPLDLEFPPTPPAADVA